MKVGLIGCGGIAGSHIQSYKMLKNVEVFGVCDLDPARAKNLASRFQIEKVFTDYWDMINNNDLDLIDVCTPVSTHAKIVCDVAKAVPSILVEKPMALTTSGCEDMIKAVKKHGNKLCVGHTQIFSPHIQRAKALVDSKAFNLFSFRTTQKESFEVLRAHDLAPAWNVAPSQGGILWEVCCHLAYLQLHFLPDIKEVYALGSKVKYPVYDDFAVLLRTEGERFGLIELSWVAKEPDITFELRDSTGKRFEIYRDFDFSLEKSQTAPLNAGGVVRNMFVDEIRFLKKWARFGSSYVRKRKMLPSFNLIRTYVDSIEKDLPSPVSPKNGRDAVELLECIKKSLNEHRPVEVNL